MKTTESNALIAEFLGYKNVSPDDPDFNFYEKEGVSTLMEVMSMQFHKSLDWLMPVVDKITALPVRDSKMVFNFKIEYYEGEPWVCWMSPGFKDYDFGHISNQAESMLDAMYATVVEFLKWYKPFKTK